MKKFIIALSMLAGLSGCATTGKVFKSFASGFSGGGNPVNCTSNSIGNTTYTNCN